MIQLFQQKLRKMSKTIDMTDNSEMTERALDSQQPSPSFSKDVEFVFGFNVNVSQILDLFESVARKMNFQMVEAEQTYAMAVKNAKKNFIQLLDCFNWWTESNLTAVKMTIHTSEKDSKRRCKIRGLVGSRKEVIDFALQFKTQTKHLCSSKQLMDSSQQKIESSEQKTNPFYLQSCAAYMFHKILSNKHYGLGSFIFKSIEEFKQTYRQGNQKSIETLLPAAMKDAVSLSEKVVSDLYKDFNYGREQMEQIMPYCRISVEKYIFEKLYPSLINLYKIKNSSITRQFNEKKKNIIQIMTPVKIFTDIDLGKSLWMVSPQDPDLKAKGALFKIKTAKIYSRACRELQKITSTQCPREKVKYCQIMFTYLKTTVYEETKGKHQLFNMEDIIPILILMILMVQNIEDIKEELDMMVDFIGFDPCDLEGERRLLVNLTDAFNYVARDWKVNSE